MRSSLLLARSLLALLALPSSLSFLRTLPVRQMAGRLPGSALSYGEDVSDLDIAHLRDALYLAGKGHGYTRPNPAVGCVIVSASGEVLGRGWHPKAGEPHAEVWALRGAGGTGLQGATAYVTLEPCSHYGRTPPCCDALVEAQVSRVVVGMVDPDERVSGRGLRKMEEQRRSARSKL